MKLGLVYRKPRVFSIQRGNWERPNTEPQTAKIGRSGWHPQNCDYWRMTCKESCLPLAMGKVHVLKRKYNSTHICTVTIFVPWPYLFSRWDTTYHILYNICSLKKVPSGTLSISVVQQGSRLWLSKINYSDSDSMSKSMSKCVLLELFHVISFVYSPLPL